MEQQGSDDADAPFVERVFLPRLKKQVGEFTVNELTVSILRVFRLELWWSDNESQCRCF